MPADLDALLTHVYVLVDDLRADGSAVVPFGSQTASGMPIGFELAPPTPPSVWSRPSFSSATGVGRSLASSAASPVGCWLAAAILHNWSIGEPARSLVAYDH